MSTEQTRPENVRPARTVKLKSAFYFCVFLVLVFIVIYAVNSRNCRLEMRRQAESFARSLAGSVAIFGNKLIVDRSYSGLQERCDELVQGGSIAYVAVSDSKGRIVAHTNREFLGRNKEELKVPAGVVEESQSAMNLTREVGKVYVGIRLR